MSGKNTLCRTTVGLSTKPFIALGHNCRGNKRCLLEAQAESHSMLLPQEGAPEEGREKHCAQLVSSCRFLLPDMCPVQAGEPMTPADV